MYSNTKHPVYFVFTHLGSLANNFEGDIARESNIEDKEDTEYGDEACEP